MTGCGSNIVITPYVLSVKNQQCGEYSITKQDPITFAFVKWHPLTDCEGYFLLPADQTAEALRQYRSYQSAH